MWHQGMLVGLLRCKTRNGPVCMVQESLNNGETGTAALAVEIVIKNTVMLSAELLATNDETFSMVAALEYIMLLVPFVK